ncbi:MAG TPA: C69 family dipeptidase [Bacteroidales bacterium]|nr:C69 family dipeptidase [Bacteroidales bacterium]
MKFFCSVSIFFILVLISPALLACTSYLVTPGASVDSSAMISYAADSHIRYGELYFYKGGPQPEGSYYQMYCRSTHKPLIKVPNPSFTYSVVGYINEKQVAMGETTFGGRSGLRDTTGLMDYGGLMFLALQRSASAREAIKVIGQLVEEYGYYSDGESFSISDPNEVWIMEIIGKGTNLLYDEHKQKYYNADKGAVWVAVRIPDGYISAHANHARITNFPLEDGINSISSKSWKKINNPDVGVIYAHDVISFARKKGFFDAPDAEFSFSDVYAPVDFGAARFCEARVWSMFRKVNSEMEKYENYAMGYDLENRMPLYIKPDRKLSVQDLMSFKRDHLQGTKYDMTADIGAGPWGRPYRWRPMTWKLDGKTYFHERTTATQQTAFSFITQSRRNLPDPVGGIIWFGVDDANTTVYVPMYAGIRKAPEAYAEGNGSILEYSENSAFWTFNKVSNFSYLRYNLMLPDIQKVQSELENRYKEFVPAIDKAATELFNKDPELARDFVTDFSVKMGNYTVQRWEELFRFLMVKFIDGNLKKEENGEFVTNKYGKYPIVIHPEYPEWWLRLIVETTGDKFLYLED